MPKLRRATAGCIAWFSAVMLTKMALAQETHPRVTDAQMGAGTFELYAKSACAEGRPDAVSHALREALEGAALLQERAPEIRRGVQEAHSALVAKGGCRGFPPEEIARIRENQEARARDIREGGGEMEVELPATLGGRNVTGRASYGTIAHNGIPFSVLCLETPEGALPQTRLLFISPNADMLKEGSHDLGALPGTGLFTVSGSTADTDIRFGMLGVGEKEGNMIRGSFAGFLRSGSMLNASFTAVPVEDPCEIGRELGSLASPRQ